ncbi:MAG: glycosyltransferase family 2 protein [Bacteriovoracaceae bacterium]|nr:glycosyltransferase family 2 protein [Bacteriovoracaceae bacterium]
MVIPAYNEEGCLNKVLEEWITGLRTLETNFIIYVINDGSKDSTEKILKSFSEKNTELQFVTQENQGHGIALRNGYDWAISKSPDWIFHVDSDDQFKFKDFPKLWNHRNEAPVHYGYRMNRNDPLHRIIISRILRIIIFITFGIWIPDSNVPYRLLNYNFLKSALPHISSDFFAPNIFVSLYAFSWKGDVPVHPVAHIERQTGEMSLPSSRLIKACIKSFIELIKFRFRFASSKSQLNWDIKKQESQND